MKKKKKKHVDKVKCCYCGYQVDIEEKLYNCFKKVFDAENGKLCVPLNRSTIVYDLAGFACSDEFLEKMYERWLSEGNKDEYYLLNS